MVKKSLFDGILGKKQPKVAEPAVDSKNQEDEEAIKHLYITEDDKKNRKYKKKAIQSDPKIDTGILRNRIAEKIAKMNNN